MSTEPQTNPSEQNFWKIFLLALFFGFLGVHRFVVGKTKTGILQLITFGGLGLWAFVDIVRILLGKFTDGKNQAIANSNPKAAWAVFAGVLLIGMASNGGGGAKVSGAGAEATRESDSKARDGRWVSGSGGGADKHVVLIMGNQITTILIQGRNAAPQIGKMKERSGVGNGTVFDCEVKSDSGSRWEFEMTWDNSSQAWTLKGLNYSVALRKMTSEEWDQFNATSYKTVE